MDLITTGISASERLRRENLVSATRNMIMEKMQLGGSSMRLLEVCYYTRYILKNIILSSLRKPNLLVLVCLELKS